MKQSYLSCLLLFVIVCVMSVPVYALLELSVTTNQDFYLPGETVEVYVSVTNTGFLPTTLSFSNSLEATYVMDDTYDWSSSLVVLPMTHELTINGGQTLTWQLDHDAYHQGKYPLGVGLHMVQGSCTALQMFGQLSDPVLFEVIPEPATLALMALGAMLTRIKRKN